MWKELQKRLEKKYAAFPPPKNDIEKGRNFIANQCKDFSSKPKGIYTLSVPTGSGKTLSSMRFALGHAAHHNMRRIIEVIPFTSIIDQNAAELSSILQKDDDLYDYVLEHHSNVDYDEKDPWYTEKAQMLKATTERWDSPIIFTTQVRLLNVLFGSKTSDVRRLAALQNSIIIFDEIQTIPLKCIFQFNYAINMLRDLCGCTIVFCTATQPTLDKVHHAVYNDGEIVNSLDSIFAAFNRNDIQYNSKRKTIKEVGADICIDLKNRGNVLCIMNTTKSALKMYFEVVWRLRAQKDVEVFYLSTKLCPAHRSDVLKRIKEALSNKRKIVCVTTQLIEAGVDISFTTVYRSLSGLSSIAQASGRCNRHGEMICGLVKIFRLSEEEENLSFLPDIAQGAKIVVEMMPKIIEDGKINDLFSPAIVQDYFNRFYLNDPAQVRKMYFPVGDTTIFDMMTLNCDNQNGTVETLNTSSLATAANEFFVIADDTVPVLVPYQNIGLSLMYQSMNLNPEDVSPSEYVHFMKSIQKYTVNLFPYEIQNLLQADKIMISPSDLYVLKSSNYDNKTGIIYE